MKSTPWEAILIEPILSKCMNLGSVQERKALVIAVDSHRQSIIDSHSKPVIVHTDIPGRDGP